MAAVVLASSVMAIPQMQKPIRASFYASAFENRKMANGAAFHQDRITAASRSYPLGSILRVESVQTGKSVLVTVTDRGPWCKKFSLDLSKAAFRELGLNAQAGWGWVTIERFTE